LPHPCIHARRVGSLAGGDFLHGRAWYPADTVCQRLADNGYVVLLPDLFYRAGPYEPLEPKKVFAAGDVRTVLAHQFNSTDNRQAAEDTEGFLAYIDRRSNDLVTVRNYCSSCSTITLP
jgi:dienelactone hydrolase